MNEELYTPQEVADLLKIKKNTVYELIKRGDLKCRKIGKQFRIRKDDLEEYLNLSQNDIQGDSNGIHDSQKDDEPEFIPVKVPDERGRTKADVTSQSGIFHYDEEQRNRYMQEAYGNRGLIICGQDILLEVLCNYLSVQIPDIPIYRSYLGSYNGLYALYQGKVDVATAHLWDWETGEYNKDYVKRMLPGIGYRRIHLVSRMQGFYVKQGNPKEISGFRDLARPDVIIINREKGSGTRILLDQYLTKEKIQPSVISGYEKEVNSHLACAAAVARGSADVGIGNERISRELKGIDFIPIQMESYDLVVREDSMKFGWYQELVHIINNKEFREELERLSGYDTTDIGLVLD